jgi:uncharacterized Zn-binding protein involved in type VI secretion
MQRIGRRITAALVACFVASAPAFAATGPQPKPTPGHLTAVESAIAIAVNGDELPRDPAPRIVGKGGGRLVVPVVKIYSALGIAVQRTGDEIVASAPGKRIVIHVGSARAEIDGQPVTMESPAIRIDGATYVPLRFVADSLGAQVTFNAQAMRVEVVSSLVGRNPGLEQRTGGGTAQIVGTVSAVDLNSSPPSITLTRGSDVRTIAVTSDAKVELQDVVARISTAGELADVHPGDAASVLVLRNGHVQSVIVRYASRSGTIAAVSSSQFVLNSGFIVSPDSSTVITLDAQPATLSDLKVGDAVVVRLNPDTNEKREIIASRLSVPLPAASGAPGPAIASLTIAAAKPALKAGDTFEVTMTGTPGGRATYDIGTYVTGQPLTEGPAGTYTARYAVPGTVNFGETPVYGHLIVDGNAAPRVAAPTPIAVSNTPPQIVDIAPSGGQSVNNDRPSIFATFRSPVDVGINPASISIEVNGLDVTAAATRTEQFVTYSPGVPLADGDVTVVVRVSDRAGNTQSRSWSFTVHAH